MSNSAVPRPTGSRQRGQLAFAPGFTSPANLNRDMQAILHDYQEIGLARNRPGGLKDSVARLERVRADYGT